MTTEEIKKEIEENQKKIAEQLGISVEQVRKKANGLTLMSLEEAKKDVRKFIEFLKTPE